jgi:hypothetical protein
VAHLAGCWPTSANPDLRDLQLIRVDHSTKRFLTWLKLPQFFMAEIKFLMADITWASAFFPELLISSRIGGSLWGIAPDAHLAAVRHWRIPAPFGVANAGKNLPKVGRESF